MARSRSIGFGCITAATFSVFHIAAGRSGEALEQLVGPDFAGYLNFDYFSANCSFAWNHWIRVQFCWANLIRDIRVLAEKHPDKKTKAWAEALLDRSRLHRMGQFAGQVDGADLRPPRATVNPPAIQLSVEPIWVQTSNETKLRNASSRGGAASGPRHFLAKAVFWAAGR